VKRSGRQGAVTLIELMAVVTLIALAVGMVILSVNGLSENARLQAAATQIGALYRIALCEAMRTGQPRILAVDRTYCSVQKPTYEDAGWRWSTGPSIRLASGVRVSKVQPDGGSPGNRSGTGPSYVAVRPSLSNVDLRVELSTSAGRRATAVIDAVTGSAQVTVDSDE